MTTAVPHDAMLTEEHLAFLRGVDSPTIANAIEPFKVRDRCDGYIGGAVRCLFPELGVMVGTALTVKMSSRPGPPPRRDGYWQMWEALERMPGPSVLVVQDVSDSPSRCAHFGEVMATFATRLGTVGLVTDGGVRDLDEVRALGLRYFAAYVVVSHGSSEIVEVGAPVTLDGQTVRTGDVLHGDANGVVIVPAEVMADLPRAVADVRANESRFMEFLKSESFSGAKARERRGACGG